MPYLSPLRHYGICTTSPTGRTISRLLKEEVRQKLEAQYDEPSSQEIYKLRKEKVELPFGHIKHNLKFDSFLLRGLKGVKAEASILAWTAPLQLDTFSKK